MSPQQIAFENAKKTSQELLSRDKYLQPVALTEDQVILIDPADMQEAVQQFSKTLPWFVLIHEVWFSFYDPEDTRMPSQREDRKEAVMVMLVENGVNHCIAQCPFRRASNGDIYFEDWVQSGGGIAIKTTEGGIFRAIKNTEESLP